MIYQPSEKKRCNSSHESLQLCWHAIAEFRDGLAMSTTYEHCGYVSLNSFGIAAQTNSVATAE